MIDLEWPAIYQITKKISWPVATYAVEREIIDSPQYDEKNFITKIKKRTFVNCIANNYDEELRAIQNSKGRFVKNGNILILDEDKEFKEVPWELEHHSFWVKHYNCNDGKRKKWKKVIFFSG